MASKSVKVKLHPKADEGRLVVRDPVYGRVVITKAKAATISEETYSRLIEDYRLTKAKEK